MPFQVILNPSTLALLPRHYTTIFASPNNQRVTLRDHQRLYLLVVTTYNSVLLVTSITTLHVLMAHYHCGLETCSEHRPVLSQDTGISAAIRTDNYVSRHVPFVDHHQRIVVLNVLHTLEHHAIVVICDEFRTFHVLAQMHNITNTNKNLSICLHRCRKRAFRFQPCRG